MIAIEEFKNMLTEEYTGNKKDIMEQFERVYSDNYLQKIIDDTYSLVKEILDYFIKTDCFVFEDTNDFKKHTGVIYLTGSDFEIKDKLYVVSEDRIISTRIMKKVFGESLNISNSRRYSWFEDERENEDDDWCVYTTKIIGLPTDKFDEIRKELFGKSKSLVREINLNK